LNAIKNYYEFIDTKRHIAVDCGFDLSWRPEEVFDFQLCIAERGLKRGRVGIFLDTGLGKTRIALIIAQNMIMRTNKKVLILTPLAVAYQFIKEAQKIGIDDIEHSRDGKHSKKIVLCNYERLHYMNSGDFDCIICDESSILKNFNGQIKWHIIEFVRKIKYRYLMSATPAPNDYLELGNSSEALGYMGFMKMLNVYFHNTQNDNDSRSKNIGVKYYLKPHAEKSFFEWVGTWAIMIKKPSDIGFSDDKYILPELIENMHFVEGACIRRNGMTPLFAQEAQTMYEIREEQKQTENTRCEQAAELARNKVSVYWCNTNNESYLLKNMDKDAKEIIGSQSIDEREEILKAFSDRKIDRIITKSKMTGLGMNWQHCCHTVVFPNWSYEQYYQLVRRFWRFGQKEKVIVDRVLSEGQKRVLIAQKEKKQKAERLYENILKNINSDRKYIDARKENKRVELPDFIGV